MPNIRTYNPNIGEISVNDRAANAAERAGRHIKNTYDDMAAGANQVAAAQSGALERTGARAESTIKYVGSVVTDYVETKDKLAGAKTFGDMTLKLSAEYNKRIKESDPNDPTVLQKFREEVLEPELQKFRNSTWTEGGQKWAEQRSMMMQQHFLEKGIADQAVRAGQAAVADLDAAGNRAAATVFVDHTMLDLQLKTMEDNYKTAANAPGLSGTAAGELLTKQLQNAKEKIVKTAFLRIATQNPDAALASIESGEWSKRYGSIVSKGDLVGIARAAQAAKRADAVEQRLRTHEAERVAKKTAEGGLNKIIATTLRPDGTISAPPGYTKQLQEWATLHGQAVEPGTLKTAIEFGASMTDKTVNATDPEVYMDFAKRLEFPPEHPQALTIFEVMKARVALKLNKEDAALFTEVVTKRDDKRATAFAEFNKQIEVGLKHWITRTNPMVADRFFPDQDERWSWFLGDAKRQFEQAWARDGHAGVQKLLDPNSSTYIGHQVNKYRSDTKEGIKQLPARIQGNAPRPEPISRYSGNRGSSNLVQPGETSVSISVEPARPLPPDQSVERKPGESQSDYLKRRGF